MSRSFELLTPRGPGGVAVVAVRGADRGEALAEILRQGAPPRPVRAPDLLAAVTPRRAGLWLDGAWVDEVLVVARPEQRSLEIHLHGSPAVLTQLAAAVGPLAAEAPGAPDDRSATLEAELQAAVCREQLQLCLEQRELTLEGFLAGLPAEAAARRRAVEAALARSEAGAAQWQPLPLVLCGTQNAGKSTLMNRLLARDRVLTGALPGLTRDPVRETTVLDGYPYELFDTAGEGRVADGLDAAALALARAARAGRHRMLVVPGTRAPEPVDRELRSAETFVVRSMADLEPVAWPSDFAPDVTVSCRDARDAAQVRLAVGRALRTFRGLPPAGPVGGFAAVTAAERAALAAARS